MDPEPDISPERIGGFRVLRRLSSGATTDVLLARAEGPHGFERVVALKVLLQQYQSDPAFERMFAREASAYARLSHPAIVKLYDFFSTDGQLVMVLEYVDGLPLHKLRAMLSIGGERLDDSAALFIGSRIFAALGAAHSARDPEDGEFSPVIHRDVNPSNVLVPWDGHVKISDFGIAKIGGSTGDTRLGFVKGTYGYMAPEQVRGENVTVRADVYAATLVLWELLARRKAIQRGALPEVEVLKAMAEPQIPSLDALRPELRAEVRDAVRRGLEPDPDRRGITADEMASVLRLVMSGDEGRARLAEAIARVRPAPTDGDLAVTKTHPAGGSYAPPMSGRGPLAETLKGDPDETSRLAAKTVPEDSGAFKLSEIAVDKAWSAADSVEEPPGSSGDLTVIEARRPATSDAPPTLPPDSEPGTIPPQTLPLPHSAPPRSWRQPAQGFVRAAAPDQPNTLRFGPSEPPPTTQDPPLAPAIPPLPPPRPGVPLAKVTLISSAPPPAQLSAPEPALPRFPMPSEIQPLAAEPPPVPAPTPAPTPALVPALALAPAPALAPMPASAPVPAQMPSAPPGPPPVAAPVPAATPPAAQPPTARALAAARPTMPTVRRSSSVGLILGVVIVSGLLGVGGVELYIRYESRSDAPSAPSAASVSASTRPVAAPAAPAPAVASVQPKPKPSASSMPVAVAVAPSASQAPVSSASASASPSNAPLPVADPVATPAGTDPQAAAAGMGDILTRVSAGGHRIFVDDRVVGNSPDPARVRCGKHTVRIGSAGTPRDVDIPCGGSLVLTP